MIADLKPFEGELSLLRPASRFGARATKVLLLSVPTILLSAFLTIETVRGGTDVGAIGQGWQDVKYLLGISETRRPSSFEFPLGRDVLTIVAMYLLSLTPLLIYVMWSGYARMLSAMYTARALTLDPADLQNVNASIGRCNRDIRRIGYAAPLVLCALIAVMAVFHHMENTSGMFPLLVPGDGTGQSGARAAYDHWWASAGFAAVVYQAVFVYGIYLITQQNLVGIRIIWCLFRARHDLRFEADRFNQDGYYGWSQVRKSLTAVYVELAIHGLAMACVFVNLPTDVVVGPSSAAWVQWALVLPLYVAFPFLLVRPTIQNFKDREITDLYSTRRDPDTDRYKAAAIKHNAFIADQIAKVRAIPTLPFKPVRDSALFLVSVTADTAAVVALVSIMAKAR